MLEEGPPVDRRFMNFDQFLQDVSELSPARQRALHHTMNLFQKAREQGYSHKWIVRQLKADARALQDIAVFLQEYYSEDD